MNLDDAIASHTKWKLKLRSAIANQESLDAATIGVDDRCEFGKWLHGPAKVSYGALASYRGCLAAHKDFHLEAARVARLICQMKFDEATESIGAESEFGRASKAVCLAIVQLKLEVGA